MPRPSSAIFPLLAGVALLTAANALLGTLVSVRMAIEGFPPAMSGLVMSAYYAGFVLGSLYGSRVIDRVGHISAYAMYRVVAYARVEQTRFESAAPTTPAALELDPRVSGER